MPVIVFRYVAGSTDHRVMRWCRRRRSLRYIIFLLEEIMSQQAELDAAVSDLNDALGAIEAEIAALVAAAAPVDFSALNAAVARAQAAAVPPV